MMGRGLLLLAICGCYAPHPLTGAPCDEEHPCPSGQECVANRCGGTAVTIDGDMTPADSSVPNPDAGPNDFDGDGIANTDDNCPNAANANQANEDGDPLGDACDPCPIDAASPPSDPDQDGVSDSCDPRPTTPGDKIVLFEGFKSGVPSTWQVVGGTMQSGGDIVMVGVANNHNALIPPITAPTNGVVTVKGTVSGTSGMYPAWFSIGMPYDPATDGGNFCELWHPDTTSANMGYKRQLNIYVSVTDMVPFYKDYAWQNNTTYILTERRNSTSYNCTVTAGASDQVGGNITQTPADNKVAIETFGSTATISWMMVVSSQ